MVRTHQPGEAVFRSILPEDVEWKPFPAFPPSARLAVLVGEPTQAGPYVIRVKVPSGVKLMPHKHPETESIRSCPVFSTSVWAIGSTAIGSRHIHQAASSFCPAIHGTSTGQNPASTS